MKKEVLDLSPQELVALAGSLAIAMSQRFDEDTICSIRCFLSTLQANLSLIDTHKGCRKRHKGGEK